MDFCSKDVQSKNKPDLCVCKYKINIHINTSIWNCTCFYICDEKAFRQRVVASTLGLGFAGVAKKPDHKQTLPYILASSVENLQPKMGSNSWKSLHFPIEKKHLIQASTGMLVSLQASTAHLL